MRNSWKAKISRVVREKLQFDWDSIVGGAIDKNYQKPIRDGFKAMMDNGILAGYNIDSMKVRVYDGSMHAVDSKPIAFRTLCERRISKLRRQSKAGDDGAHHETGGCTPEEYVGS
jgi:elongation factor G